MCWLQVKCEGTEAQLDHCPHRDTDDCSGDEGAGVICFGGQTGVSSSLSFIFAPAEGPPFSACPQENYKLEGVDVEVTASVAGWEACSELCRRRKDCSFWSYDKSNIQCVSCKYFPNIFICR